LHHGWKLDHWPQKGASGAVSVKALARKNARTIASIGTGNQARMQIRAVNERMKIEKIHAWSRTPESLSRYKTDIQREFGIPVIVASSKKEAVEQADILITTTPGKRGACGSGFGEARNTHRYNRHRSTRQTGAGSGALQERQNHRRLDLAMHRKGRNLAPAEQKHHR
jgi:hypothetical protein